MRRALIAVLALLVLVPVAPLTRVAASSPPASARSAPPVALKVTTGYGERYRRSAWVPVRVSLLNRSSVLRQGTVALADGNSAGQFAEPGYSTLYQVPVVLPPGAAKQVTLYLPGQDIGDTVTVQLRLQGWGITAASDSPKTLGDGTISVGALSRDPQLVSWLHQLRPRHSSLGVIGLGPATLDAVAEALANFDVIVLSNADTFRLDRDQLAALEWYVEEGGSLLLIGGPDWQDTLHPLPPALIPGELSGSRALPDLSGLRAVAGVAPPRKATVVSVLARPRGSVLAGEAGVPLLVRMGLGKGRVVYLAFDPAVDAIARWSAAPGLLSDVLMQAALQEVGRVSSAGFQSGSFQGRFGAPTMRQEVTNVSGATRPSLILLVLLAVLSILVLAPLNFLLLHRLRRRELALVTVPALSLLCFGTSLALAFHLKGNLTLLNTVSMVTLDGDSGRHPATLYVGLFTPMSGDYHLVWDGPALPRGMPAYSRDFGSSPGPAPLGARLQEGSRTAVDFPAMNMWSTRGVALTTTVGVPGGVRGDLRLAPDGSIVGVLRNDTPLRLIQPAVVAGSAVLHLPDLPPRGTAQVHILPSQERHGQGGGDFWNRVYGSSPSTGDLASWDGDPWEEPAPAAEKTLIDRVRNVAERLPEARNITWSSEVLLVGWSQDSLGTFTVEGATPRRRDLTLVVAPLSVEIPHGPFQLRPGTIGAHLVDAVPVPPQSGSLDSSAPQVIDLGAGGSATFEFDVSSVRPVHFRHLSLSVDAGGADETRIGEVYDWRAGRWTAIHLRPGGASLPAPQRFISRAGAVLLRLHATDQSGDVVIADPRHDLQLTGSGTVG